MNLLEPTAVGLSQLRANKIRSLLTLLGILIGVAAITGTVSIGEGLRKKVVSEFSKVGGGSLIMVSSPKQWVQKGGTRVRRSWQEFLTLRDRENILRECEGVKSVIPLVGGRSAIRHKKVSFQGDFWATSEYYHKAFGWDVEKGRFFSSRDVRDARKVCVLGDEVARVLFGEENPLGREVKIMGKRFTVIGVMERKQIFNDNWGFRVFIPVTTGQKRLLGHEHLWMLFVHVERIGEAKKVEAVIRRTLKRSHVHGDEFQVESAEDIIKRVERIIRIMKAVVGGIAAISLLVGGIGIMNIMLVSVTERTREIGIRKSVGAKKRHILLQFIIEAVVLCVFGGILGILFGIGLGLGLSEWISRLAKEPFPSVVSPQAAALAILFSAGVGVFFGVYPAVKASRLNPVEALRHEQ